MIFSSNFCLKNATFCDCFFYAKFISLLKERLNMTLRIKKKNIEIFASNGIRISLQRGLKIELTDVNEISAYGTVGSEI